MTNAHWTKHLEKLYKEHPMIARSKKKYDYNISMPPCGDDMSWSCIPSVKECFIPVSTLAKHVKEVVCDEEDYGFDGISLTVYVEE